MNFRYCLQLLILIWVAGEKILASQFYMGISVFEAGGGGEVDACL